MSDVAVLPRRTKFAYGLGAISFGVRDTGFNSFILIYYNQVLGLSATLAGLALMLTLVADAFFDPAIGMLSDGWRSRLGRRHPFLYAAAVPAALSYVLLWSVPSGVTGQGLFWWLLGVSILARACMSLFEVPFVSLVAEVTDDYDERTSLITWLYVFGWWSGLAMSVTAYGVILRPTVADPSGMFSGHSFATFGLFGALVLVASMLASALGTQGSIAVRGGRSGSTTRTPATLARLRGLLADRSLVALLVSAVLMAASQGFGDSIYNYIQVFFWRLTTSQITLLALAPVASASLALFIAPRLARGREKRDLAIVLALVAVVGQPAPVVLRLLGLFPAPGQPWLLPVLTLHAAFQTTLWVLFSINTSSMIADLVEARQARAGDRAEGALFGLRIFAQKTVSGLGILLTGVVLGAVGFATTARHGSPPQRVLDHLGLTYALIQLAIGLTAALALRGYGLTRAGHVRNLAILARRAASL